MTANEPDFGLPAGSVNRIGGLRRHVRGWLLAYNYAKRLKALRFKTPLEAIKQISAEKPQLFTPQPAMTCWD